MADAQFFHLMELNNATTVEEALAALEWIRGRASDCAGEPPFILTVVSLSTRPPHPLSVLSLTKGLTLYFFPIVPPTPHPLRSAGSH